MEKSPTNAEVLEIFSKKLISIQTYDGRIWCLSDGFSRRKQGKQQTSKIFLQYEIFIQLICDSQ